MTHGSSSVRLPVVCLVTLLWSLAAADAVRAQDQPTIQKDSVRINVHTDTTMRNGVRKEEWGRSWVPGIGFRVNGPIPSGSQFYVDFSLPTAKHWLQIDCPTQAVGADQSFKTGCGYDYGLDNDAFDSKNVNATGLVDFAIKMRNELLGSDTTLFSGKFKVAKERPAPGNAAYYEYYVDEDWRIPIGYVFFGPGPSSNRMLHTVFWYRGNSPTLEAHVFYQGKDLAMCRQPGNEANDYNPNANGWGEAECDFTGIYADEPPSQGYEPKFWVAKNPGNYEIKVLIVNHLARSIKFTVNADGSFDNGIATANKLGTDRVIVPVQVIGTQMTTWDRTAWKTGAYYGNPLTGFTAP